MKSLMAYLGGPRAPWIALATGLVSAFAYQPVGIWPLMPVSFALLAAMLSAASSWKRAALIGWMFGLGQFVLGLNWIATAFTFQAAMPAFFGWIAVVLLSFYLAFYPMLAALAGWFARKSPAGLALALAGGWAIAEWLRANVFTGFSWNPVGVALVDTQWRESSTLIGTYGLSALTVLIGCTLWMFNQRHLKVATLLAAAPLMLLLIGVATPVNNARSETAIRVVQPNIPQDEKYLPGSDAIAAGRLIDLSNEIRDPATAAPSILFWPEAAMTGPMRDERRIGSGIALRQREIATQPLAPDALLVTGGVGIESSNGMQVTGATNSVYVINERGDIQGSYDKAHLVPYGEYLPMRWLLEPLGLSRLVPGSLDFTPGPGAQTLDLPGGLRMGVQVCYEIIFSGEVVDAANRPDFIFNPSNDAWFGAWGPPQHLAKARLRATEEGLPVIRSTPTGISAVITSDGVLIDSIEMGERGVIDTMLPSPAASPTLFSRLGNLIPLLLGAFMLISGVALARRAR